MNCFEKIEKKVMVLRRAMRRETLEKCNVIIEDIIEELYLKGVKEQNPSLMNINSFKEWMNERIDNRFEEIEEFLNKGE